MGRGKNLDSKEILFSNKLGDEPREKIDNMNISEAKVFVEITVG